jgi:glycosyltransferase involved in cell wall biosynthesis
VSSRVCLIRQSIYPYDSLVRREAETLRQAGFETHVICLDDPERGRTQKRNEIISGIVVHRLPLRRVKGNLTRYMYDYISFAILAALWVTSLHVRNRFDVIQVNTMPDFLVFSTIIPKLLGTRVVAMMYEPTPELWKSRYDSDAPRILTTIEQLVLAYVDCSCTVTQQLKEVYVARGADASKIKVILNVPEEGFLTLQGDGNGCYLDPEQFVLICHGAVEERYGHDTILEAVALVKSEIPGIRVRILGKGTYVQQLLRNKKMLGVDDCVDYLGYLPLAQMVQELRAANVGMVAQKASPYSNLVHTGKMYDYIALGKPVIASRLKAVEAYFGEDALRYFEAGNAQSLAEAIMDLYQNPGKRDALVVNARNLYGEYRWEKQREAYLSLYSEIMK